MPATAGTDTLFADADTSAAIEDPVELMRHLFALADAAGEQLGDRAGRVYVALVRGNRRPYDLQVNRLLGRFIDRLEVAWLH